MLQTPGRIYLADQHGTLTTAQSSRSSVFSFGPYQDAQRPALGSLLAFNEETLGRGQQLTLAAPQNAYCLVLPLTGAIRCQVAARAELVQVEQLWIGRLSARQLLTLQNPFPDEVVQLLHIWLTDEAALAAGRLPTVLSYTFAALEQGLAELAGFAEQGPFSLRLGRFRGRQEAEYQVQQPGNLVFAYVLAGAFEAEGRLLHPHDGLALWPTQPVEIEALSNNALLVVLEMQSPQPG